MHQKPFLMILAPIIASLISSCSLTVTRPKFEMTLAQVAFLAARDANAPEKAPQLYRQAEVFYIKAKSAYKRKFFSKARVFALRSVEFSEKAEFFAIRETAINSAGDEL